MEAGRNLQPLVLTFSPHAPTLASVSLSVKGLRAHHAHICGRSSTLPLPHSLVWLEGAWVSPPDWQLLSGRQGQRSPLHTRAQGRGHVEHPPRCPALVHRFASLPVPSVSPAPGLGPGEQRTPTSCFLHPQRHPLLDCTHPNLSLSCRRNTGCGTGPTGSACPRQPRSARRKLSRWAWARGGPRASFAG